MNDPIDVLVIGAGPGGLTLACDLRRRDVPVRVVDAAPSPFPGSRAKGIQPRTLEVFDDLGILPDIASVATLYPPVAIHDGDKVITKAMYEEFEATEDVPHANTLLLAQYDTDAAIRRRLEALGGTVEYGTEFVDLTADDDGVTALVRRSGGEERIRARYLVGADGGASAVRRTLGIGFPGTTDEDERMIVADVTVDGLSRDRWHVWPQIDGRSLGLCPLPGGEKFQLMLKLLPEEKPDLSQEAADGLVKEFAGKVGLSVRELHWASVWRPNIRLAERYRSGRVLLVGDAAHVHPPSGGQGLNTGIQDSYNLAWKLAQVLAGAPDALLDTYEAERQPVAAGVLGLSSELYAAASRHPVAAVERGDEERQLAVSYAGRGLASKARPEATDRLQAGDRAPDARFVDADGAAGRLHERFRGRQFTLLAIGEEAIEAAKGLTWPARGAALQVIAIPRAGEGLASFYGVAGPTLVLVRPDGYVAYVARSDFAAVHAEFLAQVAPTER